MTSKKLFIGLGLIIVILLAYGALTLPDTRTPTQKVGDAIHDMDPRQLESRTPGQKLGDAVKDTGDNIKDSTANPNQ